jgi:hypothetical protein
VGECGVTLSLISIYVVLTITGIIAYRVVTWKINEFEAELAKNISGLDESMAGLAKSISGFETELGKRIDEFGAAVAGKIDDAKRWGER